MELKMGKLDEDEFLKERKQVLAEWPTGKEVDLDEAIAFHKSLPPGKVLGKKYAQAKEKGECYPTTGMGQATIELQIELVTYVQEHGKAEVLATSPDSMTRVKNFQACQRGLEESQRTGKSHLNGLPIVNVGVSGIRKLVESVRLPIQMRYGAPDTRIIDEIAFAGGHTGGSGSGLYNFWNMNSKLPVDRVLSNHQYVHRLIGYYGERGAQITPSAQGMYGSQIPHSLVNAAMLAEMLLMAEQGVKHLLLHYTAQGNIVQDVAGAETARKLGREYLNKFGYDDVELFMSAGFSLVGYPQEIGPAFAVICINSLAAKMCGAQLNDMRTVSEASAIPTKEDIATSFRAAKVAIDLLKGQELEANSETKRIEAEMIEAETRLILDKVLELGDGKIAAGAVKAVQAGVLDNPYATHPSTACKVMGVKDNEGAVRYLDTGNLPFTKEIKDFHGEKIAERAKKQGKEVDYKTVVSDLLAISRGALL